MTSLSRFLLFLSASLTSMIAFDLDSTKRLTIEQSGATASTVGMAVSVTSGLAAVSLLAFGVLADRVRRRTLLVAGSLIGTALLTSTSLAWWLDALTLPHLLVAAVAMPMLADLFYVSQDAYLPGVLDRRRLVPANAVLVFAESPASVAAGLLKGLALPFTMVAGAVAFAVSALTFSRVNVVEQPRGPLPGVWRSFVDGLRFTAGHRVLRAITLSLLASSFFGATLTEVRYSFLATHMLASLTLAALPLTVGTLVGLLAVIPLAARFGALTTAWSALLLSLPVALLFPLGPALLALGPTLPSLEIPLAMTAMFAHAAGLMIASIALLSHRQELTPDHLLGRMTGVVHAVVALSAMAGIYAGNHLADILGATAVLWIFGAGMLLSIVPLHLVRYREKVARYRERAVTR